MQLPSNSKAAQLKVEEAWLLAALLAQEVGSQEVEVQQAWVFVQTF